MSNRDLTTKIPDGQADLSKCESLGCQARRYERVWVPGWATWPHGARQIELCSHHANQMVTRYGRH